MTSIRTLCGAVAGVVLCAAAPATAADNWPSRTIQVISPFSAGNANDLVARVVLDEVSRQLGQSFVIENRPGGGGSLGAATVAKADPDGYTVLLYSSSLSGQVVLHKSLPYDPVRDFVPVVLFGVQPSVLVAAPEKGWKSLPDLVAAGKARPGALNFASAGVGSASHMAGERLRLAADIKVQHIPCRGLAVPAHTPRAIVERLHNESRKALELPAVRQRLETFGVQAMPLTVDEFGKFARDDVAATINLAKEINLMPTN